MKIQITKSYEVPEGNFCKIQEGWAIACNHLVVVYEAQEGRCSVFNQDLPYDMSASIEKCTECKEACRKIRKENNEN